MGPMQRENVGFASTVLEELDDAAAQELNVPRQAVIKKLIR